MVLLLASGRLSGLLAHPMSKPNRRATEDFEGGNMIIAVDFDGVLCENRFPAIGSPKTTHINLVKLLLSLGHEVILWTSRVEGELESAVDWCKAQGLEFTVVNNDAPSNVAEYFGRYGCPPRKIYADVYIDDHGVGYDDSKLEFMVMDMIARKEQEHGKR